MKTIEAVLRNGEVIFKEKPEVKNAKILITFLEEIDQEGKDGKVRFPKKDLGEMKNIDRKNLYGEYLSN